MKNQDHYEVKTFDTETNKLLSVIKTKDSVIPLSRLKIGELGVKAANCGIEIRDAAGKFIYPGTSQNARHTAKNVSF